MSKTYPELGDRIGRMVREAWGSDARLESLRSLAGDASSRSYLRLSLSGAGPRTAVLMIQPDSGLSISSDELAVFAEPLREMPFLNVQRYLRSVGCPVPEVHATAGELVLLEDVGDVTLWDAVQPGTSHEVLRLYRLAIDEMISLQLAGDQRPDSGCLAFQQRFDSRLFLWELEHFLEYGFTGRELRDADRSELTSEFAKLAEDLAVGPAVLTHRDYHSWNLFLHEGRIRVIDFQDALLAPSPYDLATLLNDRATPTIVTAPIERLLIEHFLRRRAERGGPSADLDSFLPRYYRFLLQKSLKIVGRFHYLEQVKGRSGYVAMLPATFATLGRCLENLPDLDRIGALLRQSFPEIPPGDRG